MVGQAEQEVMQNGCNSQVRELKLEINELLVKENRMWRQRVKAFWLVEGDMNSRYFHSRATQRHQRNKILGMQNSLWGWVNHFDDIVKSFTDYY